MSLRFENLNLHLKLGRHEITGTITDTFTVRSRLAKVWGRSSTRFMMTVKTPNGYFVTCTRPKAFLGYKAGIGAKVSFSLEVTKVDYNKAEGRNPTRPKVISYDRVVAPRRKNLHSYKSG